MQFSLAGDRVLLSSFSVRHGRVEITKSNKINYKNASV